MNYLSFPGLGIGPFNIEAEAFKIFGHSVMWYGVIICVGMILAFIYAFSRAKIENVKQDDIVDLGIFVIIFGIIGARLYYVLFTLDSFIVKGNIGQTLLNIVSIWNGGIAIYGAIIAGFLTIVVVSRKKKIPTWKMLDIVAPCVMIGQILGRWGNFMNAEAYGSETTLPWRMGILKSHDGGATFYSEMYVHPTFLYESLWNLIGFIIIAAFYKKKKFNGQVCLFYFAWYGFGRMFIEGLRTDSLMLGSLRISQIVGGVTFIVATVLMILGYKKAKQEGNVSAEEILSETADAQSEQVFPTGEKSSAEDEKTAENSEGAIQNNLPSEDK